MFSWLDSCDIYNEAGETVYTMKGQFAWGHCLKIFNAAGLETDTVKERVLTWLPKFELYLGERHPQNEWVMMKTCRDGQLADRSIAAEPGR